MCYNKSNGGALENAMAISLEQYVAEATNAYQPAKNAVQAQLDAIPGQLQAANDLISRNYAQQQSQLNDQRNAAATSASLQAAGSGGSFGGKANLANRRYYTQSFVPAQTQLQTNQSNEMQRTRQNYEDQRTNLNSQLSSIDAQVNEMALKKYWEAVEAEKQRQWEAEQAELARQAQLKAARVSAAAAARSNPVMYMDDGYGNTNANTVKTWDFGNGYKVYDDNGQAVYYRNSTPITRGEFLSGSGAGGTNWNMWKDIWNSGTRTEGIGSDTIANISGLSGSNLSRYRNSDRYGYLWS